MTIIKATDDVGRLAFWKGNYPVSGEALMDILRPFYDWQPELKPEISDLEDRGKEAVFWKEISGARGQRDPVACEHWLPLEDSLEHWIHNFLEDSIWFTWFWGLENKPRSSSATTLQKELWSSLGCILRDKFMHSMQDAPWHHLWSTFWRSLFLACELVLCYKPEEAGRLKPLHKLWLAGNFPVGFVDGGKLLVWVV